jgi:CheY-like chemotaxis protein
MNISAWRVLVVDDNPLVCDSIRRILEFDRRQVQVAASAAEALALCDTETFDLVVLDYLMPEIKGDKLAEALKQRFPELPILMITADAEKANSPEKPPGVEIVMGKPFKLDEFRETVNRMLFKD